MFSARKGHEFMSHHVNGKQTACAGARPEVLAPIGSVKRLASGGTIFLCMVAGCNSITNSWLDPSVPGYFKENRTVSIRSALTLDESASAIPGATEPTREDLIPHPVEYVLGPGDEVGIEIEELRQVGIPFREKFTVSEIGELPLPVVGRLNVAGLTAKQVETAIAERLRELDVLRDPRVLVVPLDVNSAKYMLFGIGVSAANNTPLRAGWFPITRPDLDVLDAINLVGGLNEFVTEVYVFRNRRSDPWSRAVQPKDAQTRPEGDMDGAERMSPKGEPAPSTASPDADEAEQPPAERSPEEELIESLMPEAASAAEKGARESSVPPGGMDTLYIYDEKEGFIINPLRAAEESSAVNSSAVERMAYFEAMESAIDWSRVSGETSFRILRIPAQALRTGDPDYKVIVRPGDVIRIVSGEIGVYYVMGQVNRVGPFNFNSERVTLKAAIAAAGGLGPLAWPSRCTIYRRQGMTEQLVQVDLDAIFAGKQDDIEIRRGDIINVGTSPWAPWLARLRAWTLPAPAATVGYSFLYSRNFADIDSFAVQPNPATKPRKFENLFP